MPLLNRAQQRAMYAKQPTMAARWAKKTDFSKLPARAKKASVSITIDRPKGSKKTFQTPDGDKEITYPCDYGYFTNVHNPDDEEDADVFVGNGDLYGRFHKGDNLSGRWKPDERKWYYGLTPGELTAVKAMYGDDLLRDWESFSDAETLEQDLPGVHTKEAASKLRSMINVVDQGMTGNTRNWQMMMGGKPIGGAFAKQVPGGFQIGGVDRLPKQFRGMGLGKKLYGDMLRSLSPGQSLFSDSVVSGGAQAVWESLKRRAGAMWNVITQPGGVPQPHNPGNGLPGLEPGPAMPAPPAGLKPFHYQAVRQPLGAQSLRQIARS